MYARDRFEFLYDRLREKYDLVVEEMPSTGTRRARFVDGNTTIDLEAMHLGFTLSLHYWDTDLLRQVETDFGNRQSAAAGRQQDLLQGQHHGPTGRSGVSIENAKNRRNRPFSGQEWDTI